MTRHYCNAVCQASHRRLRRPQATYVQPETLAQTVKRHWPEIIGGLAIILGTWVGLPWVLALAVR